jgi:hypothetical protein
MNVKEPEDCYIANPTHGLVKSAIHGNLIQCIWKKHKFHILNVGWGMEGGGGGGKPVGPINWLYSQGMAARPSMCLSSNQLTFHTYLGALSIPHMLGECINSPLEFT